MTTVTTIRYEHGCRNVYHVRSYNDPTLAGAYADFMASAGYVVEIEGGAR